MSRILVLGGRGWIGSHLCPELVRAGHDVVVHDRVDGDLLQPRTTMRAVCSIKPDMVVHLAASPGRVFGERDSRQTIESNTAMVALVARACAQAGSRLCYFSTSEVYGRSSKPWDEHVERLEPVNLYGLTKLWGEQVARMYVPDDLLIIRPSMPWGPGMLVGEGRAALPTFLWHALRCEPIEVHRGSSRSWCYIDDAIAGMVAVIERGEGTINVGRDDDERSMKVIAEMACAAAHAPVDLVSEVDVPSIASPVKRVRVDRLRALGWEPCVSLEDGMRLMLDDLRSRMREAA